MSELVLAPHERGGKPWHTAPLGRFALGFHDPRDDDIRLPLQCERLDLSEVEVRPDGAGRARADKAGR